ncbi:MAG TPA: SpoIIE family protein phosphatase [Chlamydiales bacterium]|nr:SpoIIE family protein phosphatase [Chlamydiales bacterium]
MFLSSIFFIALPLFLYNFYVLYSSIYQEKNDLKNSVAMIGKGQLEYIDEVLQREKGFLKLIEANHSFDHPTKMTNDYLKQMKTVSGVLEYFYLKSGMNGKLYCLSSSNENRIFKEYTQNFYLDDADKAFYYNLDDQKKMSNLELFIAKPIYDKKKKTINGYLVAGIVPENLIAQWEIDNSSPYKVDIAILSEKNVVIASSNLQQLHQKLEFEKILKDKEGFAFSYRLHEVPLNILIRLNSADLHLLWIRRHLVNILILICLILVFGSLIASFLVYLFSKPLKQLFSVMHSVSKGDMNARYHQQRFGFELNFLGKFFNEMIQKVIFHQKEIVKEKLLKEKLRGELKIGRAIQRSLLPLETPDFKSIDLESSYLPAKEVSGDFFDIFQVKENSVIIMIADTAGKGISGCLYSLSIRSMLRSYMFEHSIIEAIIRANNLFCLDTKDTGLFVTLFSICYDIPTKRMRYISCGHLPMLLYREGEFIDLHTRNMALGVEPLKSIEEKEIQLQEKDLLVLFTDGIIEAENKDEEFFGMQRLKDVIEKNASKPRTKDIIDSINCEVQRFSTKMLQYDDQTLIVIRLS